MLYDERGKPSNARVSLWVTLATTLALIVADSVSDRVSVPAPAYALLGGLLTALIAWAAGPRAFQYFGPQIGRAASGIAEAAKSKMARVYAPQADALIHDPDAKPREWATGDPDRGML